jgi:regulatory LuxR family protein
MTPGGHPPLTVTQIQASRAGLEPPLVAESSLRPGRPPRARAHPSPTRSHRPGTRGGMRGARDRTRVGNAGNPRQRARSARGGHKRRRPPARVGCTDPRVGAAARTRQIARRPRRSAAARQCPRRGARRIEDGARSGPAMRRRRTVGHCRRRAPGHRGSGPRATSSRLHRADGQRTAHARMAADGASNKEIAEALFVTVKTVEMHLSNTYRKLDVHSGRELPAALAT